MKEKLKRSREKELERQKKIQKKEENKTKINMASKLKKGKLTRWISY